MKQNIVPANNLIRRIPLRDKLAKSTLWFSLVALLVLSVLAVSGFRLRAPETVNTPTVSEDLLLTDSSGAAGFAELFVKAWLKGEDVTSFLPDVGRATGSGVSVVDTVAVSTEVLSVDYVEVVVAALISEQLTGGNTSKVSFYSVGIETSGNRLSATGLPSQTISPAASNLTETFAGDFKPVGSSDVEVYGEALQGFFDAYLVFRLELVIS